MSYRIRESEPLGGSIRRVVCEQIEKAIAASRSTANGKGSPVHQTRKQLKKARAALLLLASGVSPGRFKREDHRLRNVGRLISEIRDAEVRLETVKQLRHSAEAPRSRGFAETEELLAFELDSFLAAFAGWPDEATTILERAQSGIVHWRKDKLTRKQLCRLVRKSYRESREALKMVGKNGSARRFHELRKRSKVLAYQLRILRPLHPTVFGEMIHDLEALGDHLGHAHDLCFVAERLQSIGGVNGSKRGRRALQVLVDAREEDLWRTAFALGERFYALKPKEFSDRMAYYLAEQKSAKIRETRAIHSAI